MNCEGDATIKNLRIMLAKLEKKVLLYVSSGRKRSIVSIEVIEKVAFQVEENKVSSVQANTSNLRVAEAVDIPR